MAFNGDGLFYLAAGQQMWVTHWYGVAEEDHGAQWIMAHAELNTGSYPQFGYAPFEVGNFRKNVLLDPSSGTHVSYGVLVKNVSEMNTYFSIQGGGNI